MNYITNTVYKERSDNFSTANIIMFILLFMTNVNFQLYIVAQFQFTTQDQFTVGP